MFWGAHKFILWLLVKKNVINLQTHVQGNQFFHAKHWDVRLIGHLNIYVSHIQYDTATAAWQQCCWSYGERLFGDTPGSGLKVSAFLPTLHGTRLADSKRELYERCCQCQRQAPVSGRQWELVSWQQCYLCWKEEEVQRQEGKCSSWSKWSRRHMKRLSSEDDGSQATWLLILGVNLAWTSPP